MSHNKVGTEQFMPIESILRSQNQGFQVDIWSAGLVFLQLLTKKSTIICKDPILEDS